MKKADPGSAFFKPGDDLTDKHRRFAQSYVADFNATRAGAEVGVKNPSQLKQRADVRDYIDHLLDERANDDKELWLRVRGELEKIAFASLGDLIKFTSFGEPFIDIADATPDQLAALADVQVDDYSDGRGEDARDVKRVKIKLLDKRAALELLGKHLGKFKEVKEISGPNGGPVSTITTAMTPQEAADAYQATLESLDTE